MVTIRWNLEMHKTSSPQTTAKSSPDSTNKTVDASNANKILGNKIIKKFFRIVTEKKISEPDYVVLKTKYIFSIRGTQEKRKIAPLQIETLVLICDFPIMILESSEILVEDNGSRNFQKYDINKIKWVKEGDYEKALEQDSYDFRALINDLEDHKGRLQRDGYEIWKLPTQNTITRKPVDNNSGVLI